MNDCANPLVCGGKDLIIDLIDLLVTVVCMSLTTKWSYISFAIFRSMTLWMNKDWYW